MPHWRTLGVAPPPQPGATRADTWRFVRDLQLRTLIVCAIAFVLLLLAGAPAWAVILAAIGLATGVLNAVWLALRIRRDRA
jgi:small-conductance mechanosensitive channel